MAYKQGLTAAIIYGIHKSIKMPIPHAVSTRRPFAAALAMNCTYLALTGNYSTQHTPTMQIIVSKPPCVRLNVRNKNNFATAKQFLRNKIPRANNSAPCTRAPKRATHSGPRHSGNAALAKPVEFLRIYPYHYFLRTINRVPYRRASVLSSV